MFQFLPDQPLPLLEERAALAPGEIARFAATPLILARPASVTVTFQSETAAFQNVLGVYEIGPDGRLGDAHVLIGRIEQVEADPRYPLARPGDGSIAAGESFDLGEMYGVDAFAAGTRFGFFLVADGATRNPSHLLDGGRLVFRSDDRRATIDDDRPDLIHVAEDGTRSEVAGRVLHAAGDDASALNQGGLVQAVAGAAADGGIVLGFEDKMASHSDRDFNDLVIGVSAGPADGGALAADLDAFAGNTAANVLLVNEAADPIPAFTARPAGGGIATTLGVALGDLDGDGDLDALLANLGENQLLLNDGAGDFVAGAIAGGRAGSRGVALGDLDGDGDLDGYVANDRSAADQVLLNRGDRDGDGRPDLEVIDVRATARPSQLSQDVALGDLDGDGDLDAVVTTTAANRALLNLGDLNGDGAPEFDRTALPGGERASNAIALGDLDGDGDLDAVVADGRQSDPERARLLINDGDGDGSVDFTAGALPGGLGNGTDVALADLDGDGDLDAVVARAFSIDDPGTNLVLLNEGDRDGDGTPDFSATTLPGGAEDSRAVAAGDLNGDGDVDLLFTGRDEDLLLINDGASAGDAPTFTAVPLDDNGNGRSLALGDLDGDGSLPVTTAAGLPDLGTLVPSPASDVPVG